MRGLAASPDNSRPQSLLCCYLPLQWSSFPGSLKGFPSPKQLCEVVFFFLSNNMFAMCFIFTPPAFRSPALDLWLLFWPLNQCSRCILDSTFIGFCPVTFRVFFFFRKKRENVISTLRYWISMHYAHVNRNWRMIGLCSCDLMIVSVKDVEDGGWFEGSGIRSKGHYGIAVCAPHLLIIPCRQFQLYHHLIAWAFECDLTFDANYPPIFFLKKRTLTSHSKFKRFDSFREKKKEKCSMSK